MSDLGPIIKNFKKYRKNETYNGMTLKDVFELELEIYNRLTGWKNFPKLISYDADSFFLTIENCGTSLHILREKNLANFNIPNLDQQVDSICDGLIYNNITYLDLDPHNICIRENTIFLIDFDKAVIDNKPKSHILENMYLEFRKNVTNESFKKTLKEFIINPLWPRYHFVKI